VGKLKDPSRDLAVRILTEVDFGDRLNGFSLGERSGPMPVTLYSFAEVVTLLNDPYPRIDFIELETWVGKTMGDNELADQIAEAIKKGHSDQERTHFIKDLLEERLNQCKKLV
jgi:hypothetical protein